MGSRTRQVLFAAVFVAVGLYLTLGVGMAHAEGKAGDGTLLYSCLLGAAAVCGVGAWLAIRPPSSPPRVVGEAPVDAPADADRSAHHLYRGPRPPTVAPRRTSTRATVLLVIACLALTAAALPFAVHLPRWVEAEVVLGAWWMTWAVVLGVLAYRGRPLDESHQLALRGPFGLSSSLDTAAPAPVDPPPRSRWFSWSDIGSGIDGEGALFLIAAAVVVGIALAAAWVVVELAAPVLFFLAYLGVARSLRRALVASHRGDALRSGLHGAVWATAYVAPLAAVVAIAHGIFAALATR